MYSQLFGKMLFKNEIYITNYVTQRFEHLFRKDTNQDRWRALYLIFQSLKPCKDLLFKYGFMSPESLFLLNKISNNTLHHPKILANIKIKIPNGA